MRRDRAPGREYPPLDKDLSCEVAIVGCGVTGAVIAFELARAGVATVVLDRRAVGAGSTSASTALVLYDLDTPLCRLERRLGPAPARRVYAMHREGIGALKRMAADTG